MFATENLKNSYLTGFMVRTDQLNKRCAACCCILQYDAIVGPGGKLYDCGVELSPEGLFGRQNYKAHACRGTYTLHSLYLLLWANFGCFCMSLLTQPKSSKHIHGNIISKKLPLRHYCMSQLQTLWMHMRDNLGISEEQRAFFVTKALNQFLQVCVVVLNVTCLMQEWSLSQVFFKPQTPASVSSASSMMPSGVFNSRDKLSAYEILWHMSIYQPVWDAQATNVHKPHFCTIIIMSVCNL